MNETTKKCHECRYCILTDYGYSNYTVEGTTADCLMDLNKAFPVDTFYGEEPVLAFAEECKSYTHGSPVEVDVEQEFPLEDYSKLPIVKFLLEKRANGKVVNVLEFKLYLAKERLRLNG